MNKVLLEKIKESLQAVLPITIVILIVLAILKVPSTEIIKFSLGAVMLMVGLVIFNLGASESMMTIAENIGSYITKKRSVWLLVIVGFIIGYLITISEPSLIVLGDQFNGTIPKYTLILTVAVGVAIFLVLALLRIILQVNLSIFFIISFGLLFIIAAFIPSEFVPVAFDSGGVTTGPMAVPFIISLGLGVTMNKAGGGEKEDSFGMVGISSIGPILTVFILGLIFDAKYTNTSTTSTIGGYILENITSVAIAILPFVLFFTFFQIFAFRFNKIKVIRVFIGFLLTYIGLVIFLSGASIGFISIADYLGKTIASFENNWALIPFGLLFGFVIVSAEPSVVVLVNQVNEVTDGLIPKKLLTYTMSIGVSLAIGLAMVRIVFDISIWWILLPGYIIALVLTLIVPKMFSAIAFDSGGAVSGALTSTFLVPFALGAASIIYNGNESSILKNAFGLVAFVAMAPLITIQVLGLIYKIKFKKSKPDKVEDEEIIEFEEAKL